MYRGHTRLSPVAILYENVSLQAGHGFFRSIQFSSFKDCDKGEFEFSLPLMPLVLAIKPKMSENLIFCTRPQCGHLISNTFAMACFPTIFLLTKYYGFAFCSNDFLYSIRQTFRVNNSKTIEKISLFRNLLNSQFLLCRLALYEQFRFKPLQ